MPKDIDRITYKGKDIESVYIGGKKIWQPTTIVDLGTTSNGILIEPSIGEFDYFIVRALFLFK